MGANYLLNIGPTAQGGIDSYRAGLIATVGKWMDNGEELSFIQDKNMLSVNATGYPYGMSTCVRVARAKTKK